MTIWLTSFVWTLYILTWHGYVTSGNVPMKSRNSPKIPTHSSAFYMFRIQVGCPGARVLLHAPNLDPENSVMGLRIVNDTWSNDYISRREFIHSRHAFRELQVADRRIVDQKPGSFGYWPEHTKNSNNSKLHYITNYEFCNLSRWQYTSQI